VVGKIAETVEETAKVVKHARDVVSAAKVDAERSGQVVRQAREAMGGIEDWSKHIGQIIGVIDEIAFKTN
jgi:methyl-accepting chemotaxis protein